MKSPKIETNIAFEFIYTMMGVAYYEKIKNPQTDVSNSRFSHFLSDFVESNYELIPNLIRNDIRIFLQDFSCMYVTLLHATVQENFETPQELIDYLKGLSTHELLDLYLLGNETGLDIHSSREQLDFTLEELSLKYNKDAKDKSLFYEFNKYPEGIIERFTSAMQMFYDNFSDRSNPT